MFNEIQSSQGQEPTGSAADIVQGGNTLRRVQTPYITAITVQQKRKLTDIRRAVQEESSLIGEDYFYAWTVNSKDGPKVVEGTSIEGAMILMRNWGNCAADVGIDAEHEDHWILKAWFIDLESGITTPRLLRQSKSGIGGKYDADRALDMVFAIGQSKVIRNAIVAAVPAWLDRDAMTSAKASAVSRVAEVGRHVPGTLKFYEEFGINKAMLEAKIGRQVEKWTPEDLIFLRAIGRSLKEGDRIAEEEFAGATGKPATSQPAKKPEPAPTTKAAPTPAPTTPVTPTTTPAAPAATVAPAVVQATAAAVTPAVVQALPTTGWTGKSCPVCRLAQSYAVNGSCRVTCPRGHGFRSLDDGPPRSAYIPVAPGPDPAEAVAQVPAAPIAPPQAPAPIPTPPPPPVAAPVQPPSPAPAPAAAPAPPAPPAPATTVRDPWDIAPTSPPPAPTPGPETAAAPVQAQVAPAPAATPAPAVTLGPNDPLWKRSIMTADSLRKLLNAGSSAKRTGADATVVDECVAARKAELAALKGG